MDSSDQLASKGKALACPRRTPPRLARLAQTRPSTLTSGDLLLFPLIEVHAIS